MFVLGVLIGLSALVVLYILTSIDITERHVFWRVCWGVLWSMGHIVVFLANEMM